MKNLKTFLETLPSLIAGQTDLNAIFVTYNEVTGYKDGPVDTGKSGLNIVVQNGNLDYSPFSGFALIVGLASDNQSLAEAGGNAMEEEAREALGQVQGKLGSQLDQLKDKNCLAVVYAGLSAFQESLNYALETGQINDAVMTYECGGRDGMEQILDGLIAVWPS